MEEQIGYNINEEPIVLSKVTLDILLKTENPSDCISLYTFYYLTAKWQKTNQIKAVTSYTAKGLKWSEDRVRKIKHILKACNLIEDIVVKDANNKITGHYVYVKFIWTKEKSHPRDFPQCGPSHTVAKQGTNALLLVNKCLNTGNKKEKEKNSKKSKTLFKEDPKITTRQFNVFWNLYPNQQGNKERAFKAWKKLCNQPTKATTRPSWKSLRNALQMQKKTLQWQTAKYIPYAHNWLNNAGWLDNVENMNKDYKQQNNQHAYKGNEIEYQKPITM